MVKRWRIGRRTVPGGPRGDQPYRKAGRISDRALQRGNPFRVPWGASRLKTGRFHPRPFVVKKYFDPRVVRGNRVLPPDRDDLHGFGSAGGGIGGEASASPSLAWACFAASAFSASCFFFSAAARSARCGLVRVEFFAAM